MTDKKEDRASRFQWSEGDFTITPAEKAPKGEPSKTDDGAAASDPADTEGANDDPNRKE